MTTPDGEIARALTGFAAVLRNAGTPLTVDRVHTFLRATALTDAGNRRAVYWAGRATLCAGPDDLDRYDRLFDAYFTGLRSGPAPPARSPRSEQPAGLEEDRGDHGSTGEGAGRAATGASDAEILRHRDLATLSAAERRRLAQLFSGLRPRVPQRSSARRRPSRRGEVDLRATLRQTLRRAGEPVRLHHRHRSTRPRRVVVLADVSGSMAPYADSSLRWAHVLMRAAPRHTEVFTIGTRLTRVTPALRLRDVDTALAAAGAAVPDWSGGTRLGEVLRAFLDRWGQRGLARGAVVVVVSDGWERGSSTLLAEQMRRLSRLASRVVWINPHRGREGYLPVQSGMAAALPSIDRFVAGHSLAAYEQALEAVGDA